MLTAKGISIEECRHHVLQLLRGRQELHFSLTTSSKNCEFTVLTWYCSVSLYIKKAVASFIYKLWFWKYTHFVIVLCVWICIAKKLTPNTKQQTDDSCKLPNRLYNNHVYLNNGKGTSVNFFTTCPNMVRYYFSYCSPN